MEELVLTINAGSSSVKFGVYRNAEDGPDDICSGQVEGLYSQPRFLARRGDRREEQPLPALGHEPAIRFLASWLRENFSGRKLLAVGHRVAHGGADFDGPVLLTKEVVDRLLSLVPLAPLHQPYNLAPAQAMMSLMPDVPQVACFDTAFHRSMPRLEQLYALPRALIDEGIHRYGFHGLSYQYVTQRLSAIDPDLARGRIVVAHLGSGASMCAVDDGRSVATTMGFTSLEGLPMGSRSGSVDPGILLYLMQSRGMDAQHIQELLYNRSGLLGLSGVSADMRALLASEAPSAREAVDLFVLRVARELASLAASLGGLDGVVFTAGIGEKSPAIREKICRKAAWLGIALDQTANQENRLRISSPNSAVSVLVLPTDESRVIAQQVIAVLGGPGA